MYGEEESAVEKKIAYNETKREGNFSRNANRNLSDEKTVWDRIDKDIPELICGFVRDFCEKNVYKPHKTIYNALVNHKKQHIIKNKQHKTTKNGGNIYYENSGI